MHKIIGTLTVSDNYNKDLFRIHLYDNCIKFDLNFSKGVEKIEDLINKIDELTVLWVEKKMTSSEVLKNIVLILEVYHDELQEYYFSDDDLNEFGKYIDLVPIDSTIMNFDDTTTKYYKYLLKENMLKKISKQYFEKNIKEEVSQDMYLEMYNDIKDKPVQYFQYDLNKNFEFKKCNFLLIDDKVVFGYTY